VCRLKQVVIENPILNSPFADPIRHWKFDDDGITDEIVESRRISSYFVPIPNLLFMRSFASEFAKVEIVKQVVSQIPWGHMGKKGYKKIKAVLKPPQWLRHPPPHKRINSIFGIIG
jgi:hypothetical protein